MMTKLRCQAEGLETQGEVPEVPPLSLAWAGGRTAGDLEGAWRSEGGLA